MESKVFIHCATGGGQRFLIAYDRIIGFTVSQGRIWAVVDKLGDLIVTSAPERNEGELDSDWLQRYIGSLANFIKRIEACRG